MYQAYAKNQQKTRGCRPDARAYQLELDQDAKRKEEAEAANESSNAMDISDDGDDGLDPPEYIPPPTPSPTADDDPSAPSTDPDADMPPPKARGPFKLEVVCSYNSYVVR